jgi:branched-subunit amino acid transport protein
MTTATALVLVGGSAAITAAIKAAGPVAMGGRELPGWFASIVSLLAPALFAALIVTQVFADGRELGVGADTVGVAIAGLAIWRGASMVVGVVIAAVVTAGLRALL